MSSCCKPALDAGVSSPTRTIRSVRKPARTPTPTCCCPKLTHRAPSPQFNAGDALARAANLVCGRFLVRWRRRIDQTYCDAKEDGRNSRCSSEGHEDTVKRIYRLCREEGLSLRLKRPRRNRAN